MVIVLGSLSIAWILGRLSWRKPGLLWGALALLLAVVGGAAAGFAIGLYILITEPVALASPLVAGQSPLVGAAIGGLLGIWAAQRERKRAQRVEVRRRGRRLRSFVRDDAREPEAARRHR
jgi:hypothetical protein